MGLAEVLFIVFLVLKLVGVITWSWWWVTAPLWIIYSAVALILLVVVPFVRALKGNSSHGEW